MLIIPLILLNAPCIIADFMFLNLEACQMALLVSCVPKLTHSY